MECDHDWMEFVGGGAVCTHCSAAATLSSAGIWIVTNPVAENDERPHDDDPIVKEREWWVEALGQADRYTEILYQGVPEEPTLEQSCALAHGTLLMASTMLYLAPDPDKSRDAQDELWRQIFKVREKAKIIHAGEPVSRLEIEATRFVVDCFLPLGEHAEDALDSARLSLGALLLGNRYTAVGDWRWRTPAPDTWLLAATAYEKLPASMDMAAPEPFYVVPNEAMVNNAWLQQNANQFGDDAVNPN
jgi:hypothetical protein